MCEELVPNDPTPVTILALLSRLGFLAEMMPPPAFAGYGPFPRCWYAPSSTEKREVSMDKPYRCRGTASELEFT